MRPWLQDADVTLYHGDVLATLRELPAESVDCVVTSPPYWGLRDYGTPGQLGLEPTPEQYVERMVEVFREVRRVLAAHGTVWLNLGDSYGSSGTGGRGDDSPKQNSNIGAFLGKQPRPRHEGLDVKPKDLVGIPWRIAFALQQPYYTGKIKRETDRVWLAAMVEAEGCMFIHKRKAGQSNGQGYERKNDSYGAGLEVASTDRAIVERCLEIAGKGSIGTVERGTDERRRQTLYRWMLRSNECRDVIHELYPHFVAKQHEARLILGCPSSGEKAAKAHESLKALHQGGTPTIDFPSPPSLYEPGWYVRSDIVWSKLNPMPESVTDRPTKAHEYVFLLAKQPRYFFDQEAVREAYQYPHDARDFVAGNFRRGGTGYIHDGHHPTKGRGPDGRHKTSVLGREGSEQHRDGDRWPNPSGRNIRSVWEIATQPYPEAHFATFPEELARRCIAAGCPEQVCRVCGKARERIVETNNPSLHAADDKTLGWANIHSKTSNAQSSKSLHRNPGGVYSSAVVTGWTDCGHADYRPGIVLDPFMGSGTVAFVARKLGRHAVGIDLNESYLELAARRLQQQSLFAGAA